MAKKIVGLIKLQVRAGKANPSCDGPFCTKRVAGLNRWPVRYCWPALPQYFPAFNVALWLMFNSAS